MLKYLTGCCGAAGIADGHASNSANPVQHMMPSEATAAPAVNAYPSTPTSLPSEATVLPPVATTSGDEPAAHPPVTIETGATSTVATAAHDTTLMTLSGAMAELRAGSSQGSMPDASVQLSAPRAGLLTSSEAVRPAASAPVASAMNSTADADRLAVHLVVQAAIDHALASAEGKHAAASAGGYGLSVLPTQEQPLGEQLHNPELLHVLATRDDSRLIDVTDGMQERKHTPAPVNAAAEEAPVVSSTASRASDAGSGRAIDELLDGAVEDAQRALNRCCSLSFL